MRIDNIIKEINRSLLSIKYSDDVTHNIPLPLIQLILEYCVFSTAPHNYYVASKLELSGDILDEGKSQIAPNKITDAAENFLYDYYLNNSLYNTLPLFEWFKESGEYQEAFLQILLENKLSEDFTEKEKLQVIDAIRAFTPQDFAKQFILRQIAPRLAQQSSTPHSLERRLPNLLYNAKFRLLIELWKFLKIEKMTKEFPSPPRRTISVTDPTTGEKYEAPFSDIENERKVSQEKILPLIEEKFETLSSIVKSQSARELLKALKQNQIHVKACTKEAQPQPLIHLAVECEGSVDERLELLNYILTQSPASIHDLDFKHNTPLHIVKDVFIANFLIWMGADISIANKLSLKPALEVLFKSFEPISQPVIKNLDLKPQVSENPFRVSNNTLYEWKVISKAEMKKLYQAAVFIGKESEIQGMSNKGTAPALLLKLLTIHKIKLPQNSQRNWAWAKSDNDCCELLINPSNYNKLIKINFITIVEHYLNNIPTLSIIKNGLSSIFDSGMTLSQKKRNAAELLLKQIYEMDLNQLDQVKQLCQKVISLKADKNTNFEFIENHKNTQFNQMLNLLENQVGHLPVLETCKQMVC